MFLRFFRIVTKKLNIAIIVNDAYTNNFISLYNELKADKRFKVLVIVCDRIGYDFSPEISCKEISLVLQNQSIQHRIDASINDLIFFQPDFIFTSNPYDMYIKPEFRSKNLSRYGKLVHFSYGAVLIEWEGDYQFLADNPYLEHAYKIFTESRYILPDRNKFHPIGYLKVDNYLYYNRKYTAFPKFSIAWKPRWTGDIDSSFIKYIEFFYKLSCNCEIILNFIIHPMLFSSLHRTSNEMRARELLSEMKIAKNVNFIVGADFLDEVLGSDIFIGDISSTLAEFLSTNKPIIYTNTNLKLNALGKMIIEACYIVNNELELSDMISNLINGVDPKKNVRNGLFNRVFEHDISVSSAKRLKEYLFSN